MSNIRYAKRIALANKESIVTAGSLVLQQAQRYNTEIIPVDSEINALFQLMCGHNDYARLFLTASGGALIDYRKKDLKQVTVRRVLSHPTWQMGKRVTVDSATLVNKGFEVVETHHFFDMPYEKINIVLHRQSLIHALVECNDGTIFACMYPPDMRMPISFALGYPKRLTLAKKLDFRKNFSISFESLDFKKFPLLSLILQAARRGDNSLVVLNACDEVAIQYFLKKKIKFTGIFKVMDYIFSHYPQTCVSSVEDIVKWDAWSREKTVAFLDALN
jgi:1-deoxy-D-xylulose-5-phosphate reductoisomerase